ncbi:MAG TPA: Ku protein [Acidimicrobiia bacterium]|nr:Ku protein [Acidimicrobiia bacterium]
MPSSIWTGAISFGLVQVPVKLVGATKSKDVSFNQLEEGTGARIRYRKVSDKTGDEVTPDKIVRGFEVSKGRYVVVEPGEIESLQPKGSHEIEIEEFVDLDDIDPIYFEQPYYLAPDKRGEKPYALLVDAMTSLNKVAIGRIVMRSKERLVAIRPLNGALCVETMRYADEVLSADGMAPEDVDLTDKERDMARQLVESLAAEAFEPEKYHDEYREQLLDLIARKESGEEIVAQPQTEPPAKVLDLVAALEASIEKSKTAKERHPSGTGSQAAPVAKPGAAKRTTKSAAKATKAPAKKAARAKRSA